MGRFINADGYVSTGQGLLGNNMFTYCLNNPVRYADYAGELVIEITLTTAGAILGISVGCALIIQCGATLLCDFLEWLSSQWYYSYVQISFIYKAEDDVWQESLIEEAAPHTKNRSEKNRNKHENGDARRKRDQGGERKKQQKAWRPNPNKRGGISPYERTSHFVY